LAGEEKGTVKAETLFEYDRNGNITAVISRKGTEKDSFMMRQTEE